MSCFDIMNTELARLNEWLCDNNLSLNIDQSKYMLLRTNHALTKLDLTDLSISIQDIKLNRVNQFKYLRIVK